MQGSTDDKSDDTKDRFYKELEVSHENSVRRIQCKSRERRYCQTSNWE
jgi:hypothetical protein